MRIIIIALMMVVAALLDVSAAPPTDEQSVLCTLTGKVFEFSSVEEKLTGIENNIDKYTKPKTFMSRYMRARIEVEIKTINPESAYPTAACDRLTARNITETYALCVDYPLTLGQKVSANLMAQNTRNLGGSPCLLIKPKP